MAESIAFDSATARYALPLLAAGQAQKELTVNEAASRVDALLHPAVQGSQPTPPATPADGYVWLVSDGADGAWLGHDGKLASYVGGNWIFIAPQTGLAVFDVAAKARRFFTGQAWEMGTRPADPVGGTTIDVQARDALTEMYGILATLGLIPPN